MSSLTARVMKRVVVMRKLWFDCVLVNFAYLESLESKHAKGKVAKGEGLELKNLSYYSNLIDYCVYAINELTFLPLLLSLLRHNNPTRSIMGSMT